MYPANRRIHTISDKLGVTPPKQKKYKKPARYVGVKPPQEKPYQVPATPRVSGKNWK